MSIAQIRLFFSVIRRWFLLLTVSIGLIPFSQSIAADQAAELRIGYQKYGTLIILKARGALEQRLASQGVKVKWIEFPAGPQLLEGLNVNSIDFGTTGEAPPIFAQAAGAPLIYVANEPAAPESEAILVHKNSPIRSVADLKGKKVALNKGSNVHYLLVKALEKAGLNYSDIKPVYLPPADARAAFEKGNVDAWVIWDPFFAAAERSANARILVDGKGLVNNHQFYLASRQYATKYSHIIKILIEEMAKIDDWGRKNPRAVAEFLAPYIGLDLPTTELATKRYSFGVRTITPSVVKEQQKIADTFYQLKLIPKPIAIKEAVLQP